MTANALTLPLPNSRLDGVAARQKGRNLVDLAAGALLATGLLSALLALL
jgi:nitrous oxidase accessory protein NosD